MKRIGLKIFLYILRSLIYIKRGIVYLFKQFLLIFSKGHAFYRQTLGFYIYKAFFIFKNRVLKKINITHNAHFIDFLGQRWALQVMTFLFLLLIMVPQSKLFSKDTERIAGRDTVLYKLIGPGYQDFQIDTEEIDIQQLAQKDTRSWREGVAISDSFNSSDQAGLGTQEISGTIAGGSALSKPIILPGSTVPSALGGTRTEIVYHVVQSGEVVGGIAQQYGLSVATVLWANNLTARSYIRPGDKLAILPVEGVVHTVKKGDTVSSIAKLYSAETKDIVKFNKLQEGGEDIIVGETLLVPNGKKPQPVYTYSSGSTFNSLAAPLPSISAPAGSRYVWPAGVKRITQYYGWRHTGLDIAGPIGTPLYAARAGKVIRSQCGWNGGYGCYVILDHGGGVQTLYGHASKLFVDVGEEVAQGQNIAAMGSTGRSTGSHIHFEVRVKGVRVNPLQYIR